MWIVVPGHSASAPESEGSISESSWPFPALAQSVSWRGTHSPAKSWLTRWKRGGWIKRLCGRICEPSTAQHGVDAWISLLRVIPASPSLSQDSGKERTTSGTSGPKSIESLARYDQASSSWRTSQATFGWDSSESSLTLPVSGSMRSGLLYGRPMLEVATGARGCSSWATPTARDYKDGTDPSDKVPTNCLLGRQAPRVTGHLSQEDSGPQRLNPNFVEWMMLGSHLIGWTRIETASTDSAALEMRSSHSKLPSPSDTFSHE